MTEAGQPPRLSTVEEGAAITRALFKRIGEERERREQMEIANEALNTLLTTAQSEADETHTQGMILENGYTVYVAPADYEAYWQTLRGQTSLAGTPSIPMQTEDPRANR